MMVMVGAGAFEVDGDTIRGNRTVITIDGDRYACTPRSPPLSHSWSYECTPNHLRGRV